MYITHQGGMLGVQYPPEDHRVYYTLPEDHRVYYTHLGVREVYTTHLGVREVYTTHLRTMVGRCIPT